MWHPEHPPNQTVAKRIFIIQQPGGTSHASPAFYEQSRTRVTRPSENILIRRDPLFFLARGDDEFELAAVAFHFARRRAFGEQRAGRTSLDAFAALRAGIRFAPRLVEVGDDSRFAAASGHVFRSGSF